MTKRRLDPYQLFVSTIWRLGGAGLLILVLVSGCFTAEQNRKEARQTEEVDEPQRVLAVYETSQFPEAAYEIVGDVRGQACQNDVYSARARRSEAIDDMRRKARARGANALFDVTCEKTGSASECMSAIECTGQAARLASVQSLAQMSGQAGSSGFGDGRSREGTGWVVSPRFVATSYDVVRGNSDFVLEVGTRSIPAELVASDVMHNVALLRVRDGASLPPAIPVSRSGPPLGQRVFTVGYVQLASETTDLRTSTGIVSAHSGLFGDPRLYQTTVPSPFMRTSAPLLDYRGQVVGLLLPAASRSFATSSRDASDPFTYAVKAEYITALADSVTGANQALRGELVRSEASLSTLVNRIRQSVLVVRAK